MSASPARAIAVVIVNYRTPELTIAAVAALAGERAAEPGLRAIVVDGGSGDGSAARLAQAFETAEYAGWVRLLATSLNGGFGWANNQAMLELLQDDAPPDYIHLLNPDTRIEAAAVSRLADVLDTHPRCGAAGSQLLDERGAPTGSAFGAMGLRGEIARGSGLGIVRRFLRLPAFSVSARPGEVAWVTGASVMLRAEALREVGLFDTGFFLYFEEVELMVRMARAGWTIRHEPASRVAHVGGAATGIDGAHDAAFKPAQPAYWYESRRRFFTLTRGHGAALAASFGWLVGHASLLARRRLGNGWQHPVVREDARRMFRHGLAPRRARPAVTRWDEAPGGAPAWMAER